MMMTLREVSGYGDDEPNDDGVNEEMNDPFFRCRDLGVVEEDL